MWKEAVWPNMNIPVHACKDGQISQLTIRVAGLRAESSPRGLLNAKQQWLQIDATVGPVNTRQLPYLSSITNNPCSTRRHPSQSPVKVSLEAWIYVCARACVVLCSADPLSKVSYCMYNYPTNQPTNFYVTNSTRESPS